MSKKDFLQKKYEEINELKNMLQIYPKEYTEKIAKAICKISDEIEEYLKKCYKNAHKEKNHKDRENLKLTLEELKKYDGAKGNLAYVAINGVIYDVTPINSWINGNHYGVKAGIDATEFFNTCHPNDKTILEKMKVVGILLR